MSTKLWVLWASVLAVWLVTWCLFGAARSVPLDIALQQARRETSTDIRFFPRYVGVLAEHLVWKNFSVFLRSYEVVEQPFVRDAVLGGLWLYFCFQFLAGRLLPDSGKNKRSKDCLLLALLLSVQRYPTLKLSSLSDAKQTQCPAEDSIAAFYGNLFKVCPAGAIDQIEKSSPSISCTKASLQFVPHSAPFSKICPENALTDQIPKFHDAILSYPFGCPKSNSSVVFVADGTQEVIRSMPSIAKFMPVVTISKDSLGLQQISDWITQNASNGNPPPGTIHIISHGSPGKLELGSSPITAESLVQEDLSSISTILRDNFDVFIYGCNVAEGKAGADFLDTLRSSMRAQTVSASINQTGSNTEGGDWELEYVIGSGVGARGQLVALSYPGLLFNCATCGNSLSISTPSDDTVQCDGSGNASDWNTWLANHGGATLSNECGTVTWANNLSVTFLPGFTIYVNASWSVSTPGTDPDGSGPAQNFGTDSFSTIQEGVNQASSLGIKTVYVYNGTYDEDVSINVVGLNLIGENQNTTLVRGVIGGSQATIQISASNVTVAGFTITRLGNNTTDWNNPGIKVTGISLQGLTGVIIRNNIFTGNRTAIDINNSGGHTIRNNFINFNRTGIIFRNQTDNIIVVENFITNHWTIGILFLDASSGSNSPVQSAINSIFNNNNISGNWYGQIVDRQSGGSLPAPGTTNLKNFKFNWFGTTSPVITTANSAEPGYAALIPVAYGGTAVPPGGQPDIAGPASANFQYTPYLASGTDTNIEAVPGHGTLGFQDGRIGGSTNVTFFVRDECGNSSSSSANFIVEDNTAPSAQCQNITVTQDGSGNASITASQINNGSSDACGIFSMNVTPTSFTCANFGPNSVLLTVSDVNGNTSTCTSIVTVPDSCFNPVITNISTTPSSPSTSDHVSLNFMLTEGDNQQCDIYVNWGDGSGIHQINLTALSPGQINTIGLHKYASPGTYCIQICADDDPANPPACDVAFFASNIPSCSKKRGAGRNSFLLVVSAVSPAGGDPYFMGFNGIMFEFTGAPGEVYSLISSNAVRLNALFGNGLSTQGGHYKMGVVMRAFGLVYGDHKLSFSVSPDGDVFLFFNGIQQNSDIIITNDDFWIKFETHVYFSRVALHMSEHIVHDMVTIATPELEMKMFAVEYKPPTWKNNPTSPGFHFLDIEISLQNPNFCPDGIWGRTACEHYTTSFTPTQYRIPGDNLLGSLD